MNALQSYSSDDESGNESPMHKNSNMSKPDDPFTNYDDVGMDISEESGAEDDANDRQQQKPQHHTKHQERQQQQQHRQRSHTESSVERQSSRESKSHRSSSPEGDTHRDHTDKPRSSLQERLLGLASGERKSSQEERSGSVKDRRDSRHSSPSKSKGGSPPKSSSRHTSPHRSRETNSHTRDLGSRESRKDGEHREPRREADSREARRDGDSRKSRKEGDYREPRRKSRSRSPTHGSKIKHSTKSRSRSRSRDKHASHGVSHSSRGRDDKGSVRGSRDDERRKREDERKGRRSRSKSRERRRSRSRERRRSRSRSRERERHRRDRSRSRDRKRPMDIRKVVSPQALGSARVGVGKRPVSEAQQKLAALKASNPDLTTAELLRRSMEAQITEVEKQTGIALPSYYNPAAMNPVKFAEQERKKKLLWGNKTKSPDTPAASSVSTSGSSGLTVGVGIVKSQQSPPGSGGLGQASLWANTKFSGDKDGKMAEKFKRLMGVKNADGSVGVGGATPAVGGGGSGGGSGKGLYGSLVAASSVKAKPVDPMQEQEAMFNSMERQYEVARLATHTQRGFGLGFSSQSFVPK